MIRALIELRRWLLNAHFTEDQISRVHVKLIVPDLATAGKLEQASDELFRIVTSQLHEKHEPFSIFRLERLLGFRVTVGIAE